MFGIDLGDQKRMQYSTCRKAKKWYLYWFCFDLAIVNTLICMQESPNYKLLTKTNKEKRRTQVDFRMALAQQMIGAFRGSRRRKVPAVTGNCGDAQWLIQFEKPGIIRDVLNRTRDTKSLLDVDNTILDYALKMTAFSSTTKNYFSKLITLFHLTVCFSRNAM